MNDLENLKSRVAAAGVPVTGKVVTERMHKARQQAEAEAREKYPTAANSAIAALIRKLLGWLAVAFTGLFMVIGELVVVVLFPISEFVAVRAGLLAFTDDVLLSTLSAATVVIGLIVMYFVRRILADNLGDRPPLYLSLGRTWGRFAYFMGMSKERPDLDRAGELYVAVTAGVVFLQWSIILLGLIGRARDHLEEDGAANMAAFVGDTLTGDPLILFGYLGTVILTMALLQVTDAVVLYIHGVFTDTAGRIGIGDGDESAVVNFTERRSAELQAEALLDIAITAEAQQARRKLNDSNGPSGN